MSREPNFNADWARVVVNALADAGVRRFVIAPGSRSSVLVRAAVHHPDVSCTLWTDERGAGFFAVGWARATGTPAAVLTTSGTAVANLLPACLEAFQDAVPLVLLTADRPEELVEAGANQTLPQPDLFEGFTRSAADLQPDARIPAKDVRAAIHMTLHGAFGPGPNGPVHLNLRFDEPLTPEPDDAYDGTWGAHAGDEAFQPGTPVAPDIDPTILERLRTTEDGLIVATTAVGEDGLALARTLGWPLYPDVRSDLRLGIDDPLVWPHAPAVLGKQFSPRVVLLLGPHPTARTFLQWAADAKLDQILVVDEHDHRRDGWRLPPSMVWTDVAEADFEVGPWSKGPQPGSLIRTVAPPAAWARAVAKALADDDVPKPDPTARARPAAPDEAMSRSQELSEAFVAHHVSAHVRADGAIFLSNSLPVRTFGRFATTGGPRVPLFTNRGVSGIDGITSTAAGVALGHGAATALIGDQAFVHDLSALQNLARCQPTLTIVLINNGGGQIFAKLPIAQHDDIFSPWFDARHEHRLGPLCEVFGIAHTTVDTRAAFVEAYAASQRGAGPSVIEVLTTS